MSTQHKPISSHVFFSSTKFGLLNYVTLVCFFFFFQAEDGIRDLTVTGVQTCALPILIALGWVINIFQRGTASLIRINEIFLEKPEIADDSALLLRNPELARALAQIGRAHV